MRSLIIGDVFGGPGRRAVRRHLPDLVGERQIEFVVANAENAAGGSGLTPDVADELFRMGVHCLTGGNHSWDKKDILPLLESDPRVLRPLNYPPPCPGAGLYVTHTDSGIPVAVLNLMGRVFMSALDDPFRTADEALEALPDEVKVILVDAHAEATSEKAALARYLDGRVTAVIGTHTHVQTADARILPGGTAFQTDVGMTGPHDSIIGMEVAAVLPRFLTGRPARFRPAKTDLSLRALLVEADPVTGRATAVDRIARGGGGR
jgi:metallophosphoesterase (TIGR00282 family)